MIAFLQVEMNGKEKIMKIKIEEDLVADKDHTPQLDIEAENLRIYAYNGSNSSTSLDIWDGRTACFVLPKYTNADALKSCVAEKSFLALARQLCEETKIVWDGSNWKGRKSPEGESLEEKIREEVNKWCIEWEWVYDGPEDYIETAGEDYDWVTDESPEKPSTKEEWKALAETLIGDVGGDTLIVSYEDDVTEWIDALKQLAEDIWEEDEE